ncbi:MAG: hypothetical protein LBD80_01840 [Tannerella sp.]|jgi:hypothetical protein|nr:hypothetical protein [Tannerella sp.]
MNRKNKLSAIEKLLHDKAQLEALIEVYEKKLGKDFVYIRNNSSSLIISGFTSILFPASDKSKKDKEKPALSSGKDIKKTSLEKPITFFDWLIIGKRLVPIVWEIAQPFVLTWCINTAKGLIAKIFTKKKNRVL